MKYQELYQYFISCFSGDYDSRQLGQWWSWLEEFGALADKGEKSQEYIDGVVSRLMDQEPIQYIFNKAFFYDLELYVDDSVLIPRPETEELVELVIRSVDSPMKIMDIGTGSGAIALMLKKKFPEAEVLGLDVSSRVLDVARRNADLTQLDVSFYEHSLFDLGADVLFEGMDVLVSNPPYITTYERGEMTENTRHEPDLALFAPDDDVLEVYRALGLCGNKYLAQGGQLFLELNEFLSDDIAEVIENASFQVSIHEDIQGKKRMLKGVKG